MSSKGVLKQPQIDERRLRLLCFWLCGAVWCPGVWEGMITRADSMAHWSSSLHMYYSFIYIYTVHILCTYINLIHLFWSLSLLVCDVVLRRPFQFKFLFLVLCIDTSCYIYC